MNKKGLPWVFILGPTGVGKTRILLDLAAGGLPFEVISADAFQIYRGMDIGTAKPSAEMLRMLPHHLLDIRDPREGYSVAEFVHDARRTGEALLARGMLPIVSGGTAFYYRHLLEGLPEAPPVIDGIRSRLEAELAEQGSEQLHARLVTLDPIRALKIHPNDHYRLVRALEVMESTRRPHSAFSPTGRQGLLGEGRSVLLLGLHRERPVLRQRIRERVEGMFSQGLADEVNELRARGIGPDDPGMRAIGYREFFTSPDGPGLRDAIFHHTAQYAKRQMTFFRSLPGVQWLDPDDAAAIRRRIDQSLAS